MERVRSPSPEIQELLFKKTFFLICCQTLQITDTIIDNIETKTENLRLQKSSLKNGYFWKLVISLETYMKERQ